MTHQECVEELLCEPIIQKVAYNRLHNGLRQGSSGISTRYEPRSSTPTQMSTPPVSPAPKTPPRKAGRATPSPTLSMFHLPMFHRGDHDHDSVHDSSSCNKSNGSSRHSRRRRRRFLPQRRGSGEESRKRGPSPHSVSSSRSGNRHSASDDSGIDTFHLDLIATVPVEPESREEVEVEEVEEVVEEDNDDGQGYSVGKKTRLMLENDTHTDVSSVMLTPLPDSAPVWYRLNGGSGLRQGEVRL